jgi:hypothetical protein
VAGEAGDALADVGIVEAPLMLRLPILIFLSELEQAAHRGQRRYARPEQR